HPEIVAIDPQHFDPRVGTYWAGIIAGLAQPQSYMQMTTPGAMSSASWWLGSPLSFKSNPPDPELLNYLHGTSVESIADYGLRQIEGLYEHLSTSQGLSKPRYYVEKF